MEEEKYYMNDEEMDGEDQEARFLNRGRNSVLEEMEDDDIVN